eukprot:jgi/Tetstr1/453973/TSEL_040892.t1
MASLREELQIYRFLLHVDRVCNIDAEWDALAAVLRASRFGNTQTDLDSFLSHAPLDFMAFAACGPVREVMRRNRIPHAAWVAVIGYAMRASEFEEVMGNHWLWRQLCRAESMDRVRRCVREAMAFRPGEPPEASERMFDRAHVELKMGGIVRMLREAKTTCAAL